MHAKYEVSISYGSKVIANVKVDNRRDKNNMPPIIRSWGIKRKDRVLNAFIRHAHLLIILNFVYHSVNIYVGRILLTSRTIVNGKWINANLNRQDVVEVLLCLNFKNTM